MIGPAPGDFCCAAADVRATTVRPNTTADNVLIICLCLPVSLPFPAPAHRRELALRRAAHRVTGTHTGISQERQEFRRFVFTNRDS
jgi:hypothetical protein